MKNLLLLIVLVSHFSFLNAQNVGIGTITPVDKLSVVTAGAGYGITHEGMGKKLGTYIDANGGWLGTQTADPLLFFTANGLAQMTVHTSGNVGIGSDMNPLYRLDVGGRMRVRTGTYGNPFTSSGIWFDDYRDGVNRIFLGMQDSIRMGIWGDGSPGAGWAFNFNARNGNVGISVGTANARLHVGGNVLIGSGNPATGYMLSVNGKIICTETKVQIVSSWPDYVFNKEYKLLPLDKLEAYISRFGRLPNIPAATEIEQNGMELGDMVKRLMEKVEELTLYIIQLKKEIKR